MGIENEDLNEVIASATAVAIRHIDDLGWSRSNVYQLLGVLWLLVAVGDQLIDLTVPGGQFSWTSTVLVTVAVFNFVKATETGVFAHFRAKYYQKQVEAEKENDT